MKFIWENGEVYLRCTIKPKVRIRTYDWADENKYVHVDAVGYIKVHADSYEANIYGTVSPAPPKLFAHLEQAKAYVEEQSLIGLTVNRLNV